MTEYDYWIWNVEGIGGVTMREFFACGLTPRDIFYLRPKTIENMKFLNATQKANLLKAKTKDVRKDFESFQKTGISFVTMQDTNYPKRLTRIHNAPFGLFYYGELPPENEINVAMVGARNCTSYGRDMAKEIAGELSAYGVNIISGMASGIDGYSHRGALLGRAKTYAVLGNGVDYCYPGENRDIYDALFTRGGILSEYPPGMKALAKHFPQRNRIISGLSDAVLVIEAKEKSGSLITVDFALDQGKEVFALPGPVTSHLSKGCHNLIAQGASIFTGPEAFLKDLEVLRIFHEEMPRGKAEILTGKKMPGKEETEELPILRLEKENAIVYSEITLRPKDVETIAEKTGISLEKVRGILVLLQLKGYIEEVGKNQYIRKS